MNYSPHPQPVRANVEAHAAARAFAGYAAALLVAKGDPMAANVIFESRNPRSLYLQHVQRAAVAPMSPFDASGEAVAPISPLSAGFIQYITPRTALGRIPGVVQAPFNVAIPRQTGEASAAFVGAGKPIPVSGLSFQPGITLTPAKVAGIVCLTNELIRSTSPVAVDLVLADLAKATTRFSDVALLDPTVAAVDDVSPASITNDAVAIPATSTGAADTETAIDAALGEVITGSDADSLCIILSPLVALHLTGLRTTAGVPLYPDVTVVGGLIKGVPVIVSEGAGDNIIVLNGSDLAVADGGADLMSSDQATLQLNSTPDSPVTASTVHVPLFQRNLSATRVVRYISYAMRRSTAIVYVSGYEVP